MSSQKQEPDFFAALDAIENDNDEFTSGLETGFMIHYDQTPPRPAMKASSLCTFMLQSREHGWSDCFAAGWLAGFFIGMGENDKRNYWASVPSSEYAH